MEDVNRALAEVTKPESSQTGEYALFAGAIGRRGETMLNAVLARGGYDGVSVLAEQPVSIGIKNLSTVTMDSMTPIRDVFLVMTSLEDDQQRSLHGRDAAFVQVDEVNALMIARKAVAAGAQRIAIIVPTPLLLQFGSVQRGLSSALERSLGDLSPQRLLVVRPVRQHRSAGATLAQKIISVYMSIQMLMMPRTIEPVTSEDLARAVLNAMKAQADGVTIVPAIDIRGWLTQDATKDHDQQTATET